MALLTLRKRIADTLYPEGKRERRSLIRFAETDPMTGVANRRAFDKALNKAEADPKISIVVFDVNNLGLANKQVGHEIGDAYIEHAAGAVAHIFSRCFRIGGDEFASFCQAGAEQFMIDDAQARFGSALLDSGTVVSLTGSFGTTFKEADSKLQALKKFRKSSRD